MTRKGVTGRLGKFVATIGCVVMAVAFTPAATAQDAGSSTTSAPSSTSTSTSTGMPASSGMPGTLPPAFQALLPPGMTAQQALDAVKAAAGGGPQGQQNSSQPGPQPTDQTLSAGTTPNARYTASALEGIYSSRIGVPISQFGYDLIANGGTVSAVLNGAIQDTYILGAGDEILLTLVGPQNASYSARIDRDGQVVFPNLPPIAASGRQFGDVRRDILATVTRAYVQTQAYVSVGQIRQISVRVAGEVGTPGVYSVTGLSTVLDALNLAGGIKRTGSLRNITVVRGARNFKIDLYALLLTHGRTPDMTITQDDRIVVPPIGSTVAVTGDVRRPGIYELPPGQSAITERELTDLGNGPPIRNVYRFMILRIRADGKEELVDATGTPNALVRDGEVLFLNRAVNVSLGKVSLVGSVRLPGDYALDKYKTLHDLLPSPEVLAPTPYMLLGLVEHIDPRTLQRVLLPFSPLHVVTGRENMKLSSNDVVHILTINQMREFANAQEQLEANNSWTSGTNPFSQAASQQTSQQTSQPAPAPAGTTPPASSAPATTGTAAPTQSTASVSTGTVSATAATVTASSATPVIASPIEGFSADDASFFGRTLSDYRIVLNSGVHDAGVYLVSPGTTLDEVIAAAGGLDTQTDVSAFEITSTLIDNATGLSTTQRQVYHTKPSQFASIVLKPLDEISFHHVFTDRTSARVQITGEVRYPGEYEILRGERLSEVLARAGGLTNVAFPYGTVFLRRTIADEEKKGYERVANEIQDQMIAGLARSSTSSTGGAISADVFVAMQTFLDKLKNQQGLGRMTATADPSVLAAHPERDPMLEAGDTIFIPQRPSTVTVLGEVMQPGTYQFNPSADVDDYVKLAGGYGRFAEDDMTFVVYPDGSAQQAEHSWLHFSQQGIPPGSVIFVPRDVFPTDWLAVSISIADILKDFAISAASVAVLSKSN